MKLCFVGSCGHGGAVFHALPRLPDIKVCAYSKSYDGESMSGLTAHMERLGITAREYDSYKTMIEEEKPDILVVDSRFCDHAGISVYALERGIHVFSDKPAATTEEDFSLLCKCIEKSTALFWSMMITRYDAWFYTAKKLIEAGTIGKIRMVNTQKSYKLGKRADFFKNRETFGGLIPWVGIHAIDWITWLSGERFLSVDARHSSACNSDNGDLETTAVCMFEMTNDVLAHANIDYCRPASSKTHDDDYARIVGTDGIIEVRGKKVYLTNGSTDGQEEQPLAEPPLIFEDFIRAVNGDRDTVNSTEGSLYATRAALTARESADQKKIIHM